MEKWEYLMVLPRRIWFDKPRSSYIWQVGVIAPDGAETTNWYDAPAALNSYGAQGWELVGTGNLEANMSSGDCFLIFKRRKP